MQKGKWWIIIGALAVIGVVLWIWQDSVSDGQEDVLEELSPEIAVASTRVTDFSSERVALISEVVLKNPYPIALETREISYSAFVDSIKIMEDLYQEPVRISSSDSTAIQLPMEILVDPMQRVFEYFEKQDIDSADYRLETSFQVEVPLAGERDFHLQVSRKMPALRIPEVELESMDANLLASEGMQVVIGARNPNDFSIQLNDSSFRFIIEDELELKGEMEEVISLPAQGRENISIETQKESGSLTQSGLDLLFDQEDTQFSYFFTATVSSENEMLQGTRLELKVHGTLAEIADLVGL